MALVLPLALFALVVAGRPTQAPFAVNADPRVVQSAPAIPVLSLWCTAALFLAMALALFAIKMLASWLEFLPRFWQRQEEADQESAQNHDTPDIESEWDDVDEKYQDALDVTLIHDTPLNDNVSNTPPSVNLHLASNPPNPQTADRSITPVSLPAWSVRAIDSPPLGLPSSSSHSPEPILLPQRRAYRSPVPEFDVALAMQLRPGIGIGIAADSAWMVRFLMAVFGWFAVALSSNTPR